MNKRKVLICIIGIIALCATLPGETNQKTKVNPTATPVKSSTQPNNASSKKIMLAIGEWAPFTSKNLPSYGAATEIVTLVFKKAGYEPQYQFTPWKRAEDAILNGEVFASFPYVKTPERQKKYNFSDILMNSTGRFFYLKKSFPNGLTYNDISDLKKYTFGGSIGYWYEEKYRAAQLNVEYVPNDQENIKKLRAGRIQLFECNELVGWSIISNLYPNEKDLFGTSARIEEDSELHLLVSKKYPNSDLIRKQFNAALAKSYADGSITKILKKWGVK